MLIFFVVKVCTDVFNDLSSFGNRISDEIDHLGRTAELEPPTLRYQC